jgi:hypothetical protein
MRRKIVTIAMISNSKWKQVEAVCHASDERLSLESNLKPLCNVFFS